MDDEMEDDSDLYLATKIDAYVDDILGDEREAGQGKAGEAGSDSDPDADSDTDSELAAKIDVYVDGILGDGDVHHDDADTVDAANPPAHHPGADGAPPRTHAADPRGGSHHPADVERLERGRHAEPGRPTARYSELHAPPQQFEHARTTMQQHAERLAAAREREGALAAQLAEQGEQHRASTAKLGARVASLCDRLRLAEVDRQQGASTIELQAEKLDAAASRLRQSAAERQQGDNTIRLQAQRLAAAGRREHALVGQLAATAEELGAAKRKRGHAEARVGLAHEAVKIKREKLDDAEDRLEDSQELGQQLTIFQDGLMTHIDALQAQVRAAGGVPITKEAALAQGRP